MQVALWLSQPFITAPWIPAQRMERKIVRSSPQFAFLNVDRRAAGERAPRRDRDIGKVCRRNRRVVQAPLQLIGRGADIDVRAIESRNKQFLGGVDERLP